MIVTVSHDPNVRGPYTVDDLIGDITYDPAARDVLMNVLQQVGAPDFSWVCC